MSLDVGERQNRKTQTPQYQGPLICRAAQSIPCGANQPQGAVMTGTFGQPGIETRQRGRSGLGQMGHKVPGSLGYQQATPAGISANIGYLA